MVKQFFDTNILLYQFDDANPHKREIARRCVSDAMTDMRFVISTQVMIEFYANIRKFARAMSATSAQKLLLHWSQNDLVTVLTPEMIVDAASIRERYAISWWDANIVVAAQRAGCEVLLTEDMQPGMRFGNVRVENPFSNEVHEPQANYG